MSDPRRTGCAPSPGRRSLTCCGWHPMPVLRPQPPAVECRRESESDSPRLVFPEGDLLFRLDGEVSPCRSRFCVYGHSAQDSADRLFCFQDFTSQRGEGVYLKRGGAGAAGIRSPRTGTAPSSLHPEVHQDVVPLLAEVRTLAMQVACQSRRGVIVSQPFNQDIHRTPGNRAFGGTASNFT